jgi:hypothetical protein
MRLASGDTATVRVDALKSSMPGGRLISSRATARGAETAAVDRQSTQAATATATTAIAHGSAGLFALDLFRRHVLERPEDRALRRHRRRRRRRQHREAARRDGRADDFREPEVEELGIRSPAPDKKDVAGLQVAMDDAGAVRRVERPRHLDGDRQRLIER